MSAVIQAIIASSSSSVAQPLVPSSASTYQVLLSHPDVFTGAKRRDYSSGYFNDDPTWFATQTPSTITNDLNIDIEGGLIGIDNYSVQWTGYFIPPTTGTYKFRTTSDDASYVWMGAEALSGFTVLNATINNGSQHGDNTVNSQPYSLLSSRAYPIRVQYGEAGGGATMSMEYSNDGGNTWNSMSGTLLFLTSTTEGYLPLTNAFSVFELDGSTYSSGPTWTDSVSSKAFTLYNSPTWSDTNGGQFRFDAASSQYADCGTSLPLLSSFTIQGVFKLHSLPQLNELPQLITEIYPGGAELNYALGFINSQTYVDVGFFDGNGGYWNNLHAVQPTTDTWYDVVGSFDDVTNELKVYLNGTLVTSVVAPGQARSAASGIRIARRWDNEQYLDSTIKAINIWNGVLTPTEISNGHTAYNSLV